MFTLQKVYKNTIKEKKTCVITDILYFTAF